MNKYARAVKLIDEYTEILNAGTLIVCPVSGISFNLPSFTALPGVYFDQRHPIGIDSNYPAILHRGIELSKLSKMELAGVIITTLKIFGSIASDLTVFKQNEILRSRLDKQSMLNFIHFLAKDFVPFQGKKAAFFIWPEITVNNLYSFQHTCFNLKNNIGFDTLTVKEAIEQKVLLVDGKATVRSMTADLKAILRNEVAEFVSEDAFDKMQKAVVTGLNFKNDSMMLRVIDGIHKKLGRDTETFALEFKKYRAYFERHNLIKVEKELDLDFSTETADANETTTIQSEELKNENESKNTNSESLRDRIARIRAAANNG